MRSKQVKTVDAYITSSPKETQGKLKEVRKAIKAVVPSAEEKISYGMPYYGYKGRLVYFALARNHIGLYVPPPIIEEHAKELKNYTTAKATIQFPLEKKLPLSLIKKLVKARKEYNENQKEK